MALLFLEGFEQWTGYGVSDVSTQSNPQMSVYWLEKMRSGSYSNSVVTSPVRTSQTPSGRALQPGTLNGLFLKVPSVTEIYIGYGFYPTAGLAGDIFFDITESTSTHGSKGLRFRLNASSQIEVLNASTSAIIGTTSALPLSVWTYIEIKYIFSASGTLEILFDTASVLNLTTTDVRGGCSSAGILGFSTHAAGECYFDDLYICDNSGTTNNSFLGPVGVYTLFPNADATVQMTPSMGTDNYALVDDIPVDGETTHVYGAGGKSDLYELTNLPAITPTAIPGIMVGAISCKSNNTAVTGEVVIDSGGTTDSSPAIPQAANLYRVMHHIWEKAPGGASWTKTLIDALKAGIKGN